jgi:4a-hydroxytetrahydrobiopterin dehydratase
MDLTSLECLPSHEIKTPLTRREIFELKDEVPGWELQEGRLVRKYELNTFADCVGLVNEIAAFAEREGHYPDICIRAQRTVDILWYTHHCGGLSVNDFIMAAKLSALEHSREGLHL